ncbi:MAG: hypothetical protein C4531_02465 [Desulfurivibrio sp.]|jgi:hypothetical protein|nr:MAG: hypothetical protein C4531_02465 [Desulfurivibrio sp.]
MTNQVKLLLYGILFLLLLTAVVMLVEKRYSGSGSGLAPHDEAMVDVQPKAESAKVETPPGTAASQAPRSVTSRESQTGTAVSQGQLDLVTKREEARQRRDEMLKLRAETIRELGPGNTGEPQPGQ